MKRLMLSRAKLLAIAICIAGLISLPMGAQAGQNGNIGGAGTDPPIVVGAGWTTFSWSGAGTPFDLEGPFTFQSADITLLKVTDAFCRGDRFKIYDNGVLIGETSLVAVDPQCQNGVGDPAVAYLDPTYSHGEFVIPAGVHSITIQTSVNPFDGGAAFLRVDAAPLIHVGYAANLNVGDSVVNITNTGTQNAGGALTNICVNVYAFSPDEQLISCCSCVVTPNALVSLSARSDLISNTLTPAVPNSIVVKLVPTAGVACNASNVPAAAVAAGLQAFGTTLHATPTAGTYGVTEWPFAKKVLSAGELARITSFCGFIQANGSGYGICRSCRLGGQGAIKQ